MEEKAAILELRARLGTANEKLDLAMRTLSSEHRSGELEEYRLAEEQVLDIERKLAAALGEPYAAPLDFPFKWDIGAPLPHLIQSDYKTFLLFLIDEPDPNWDGSYVNMVGSSSKAEIGIVEFRGCVSTKFGCPNDEVFQGHPLNGKGLQSYCPMVVHNSPWVDELKRINSVHQYYNAASWSSAQHLLFGFHDTTFECVVHGFEVSTAKSSIKEALINVAKQQL